MTYEPDIGIRREYKVIVPIEGLVAAQINRISEYRSKKMWENYEESVDMLIDLLPPESEEKVLEYKKEHNVEYDLSTEGKQAYVLLFRFIKKVLAKENIVWKRSSFEIGHE